MIVESIGGVEVEFVLLLGLATILFASFVKGVLSFGIGLIAIPILVQLYPPHLAITAFIVPLWLSNLILMYQVGIPWETLRDQRLLGAALIIGTLVGAIFFVISNVELLYLLVALYVFAYLAYTNSGRDVTKYAQTRTAGVFSGGVSGFLTSINMPGPPMVAYMHGQQVEKQVFTGVLVTWFAFLHTIRFGALGYADVFGFEELVLGLIFCVPMAVGIVIGSRVQRFIPQRTFEKLVEIMLAILALRLLVNALG